MVKEAFKETAYGKVPTDWNVVSLESVAVDMADGPFGSNLKKIHYTDNREVRIIQLSNIGEEGWKNENVKYTTFDHANEISRSIVKPGDAVVAKMMPAGRTIVCPDDEAMYVLSSDVVKIVFDKKAMLARFFAYVTKMQFFQKQISNEIQGSTRVRTSISKLKKNCVALPSITEQTTIADTLSDVDELIASLDKLITKKKNIRTGAMQELITGKRRIPGFTAEWGTTTLESLCYLITKQTGFDYSAEIKPSLVMSYQEGTLPFIQNKDFEGYNINYDTDFFIPYDVAIKYPKILLNERCLLISISGKIGNVAVFDNRQMAFVGGAVGIAKLKDNSLADWCMLYLLSSCGQEQIFSHEKVGAQHNLTVEDVRNIEMKIPDEAERNSIVDVLTDMDFDIQKLEEKLLKCRQIKQGMMNELLTGKIRLV